MGELREIINPEGLMPEEGGYGRFSTGILPSHVLKRLVAAKRELLADEPIIDAQIQPASIDLRLGPVAFRVRASFLPGKHATVEDKLTQVFMHEIDLTQGAVLEAGCWSGWNSRPALPAPPTPKAAPDGSMFSPA
jgi:hypothetical protein